MSVSTPIAPMPQRVHEIVTRFQPSARSSSTTAAGTQFASTLADLLTAETGRADESTGAIDLESLSTRLQSSGLSSASAASLSSMYSTTKNASGPTGDKVVAAAQQYLGVPYKWGGTDPAVGLDCSGFVQRAYADVGVDLPRVSYDQAKVGTEVPAIEQARPGDLIAFGSPVDHIAIYVGDGKIIQAPHTGDVVRITDVRRPIATIRRVLPDETAAGVQFTSAGPASSAAPATSTGATGVVGAEPYEQMFQAAGAKYGLNPLLLAAVAKTESNFNPSAASSAGAIGLMQFMPATAKGLGIDPCDPAQAIDGAARYLRAQLDRFGTTELALAAYNAGPGAVQRFGGVPPYSETQSYVSKVIGQMNGQSATNGVPR